jgi:hypothetical protein|tara:strand:+ start:613 stop:1071 length:459 start_codon:yes stop_codon:yes gene_type:complete
MTFQPSSAAIQNNYGILGLNITKRERRDAKNRRAQYWQDSLNKLEEKGKGDSKRAKRLRKRIERLTGKAAGLDEKLKAKGKTTSTARALRGSISGAPAKASMSASLAAQSSGGEEGYLYEDDSVEEGGPDMRLIGGAFVAIAALGTYLLMRK